MKRFFTVVATTVATLLLGGLLLVGPAGASEVAMLPTHPAGPTQVLDTTPAVMVEPDNSTVTSSAPSAPPTQAAVALLGFLALGGFCTLVLIGNRR